MNSRLALKNLVRILREAPESVEEEKGEDSIDSQIDQYFSDFEKEGKNAQLEGRDFRRTTRRFLLEAEEDEEKAEEKPKEEEPKKLTAEDINVDSFANGVVRLIDNYDSLLEVRNTIIRRAVNFLLKSYEPDVADSFKESLEEKHGLQVGKSKQEQADEEFQPPSADRAGTSPGA